MEAARAYPEEWERSKGGMLARLDADAPVLKAKDGSGACAGAGPEGGGDGDDDSEGDGSAAAPGGDDGDARAEPDMADSLGARTSRSVQVAGHRRAEVTSTVDPRRWTQCGER